VASGPRNKPPVRRPSAGRVFKPKRPLVARDLIGLKELAAMLRCSYAAVRTMKSRGTLPRCLFVRIGRRVYASKGRVDEWLQWKEEQRIAREKWLKQQLARLL